MNRRRDPLRLSAHWHVDCRIETDLPEDSVVGAHFFANVSFGTFTVAVALLASWLTYRTINLRSQIQEWEQRITENRGEVEVIRKLQREYVAEASRIDQAYATIRAPLYLSEFLMALGRTLPTQITVDMIEWNENGVMLRGVVRETKRRAGPVLGNYIEVLRKDSKVGPHFTSIKITGMPLPKGADEQLNFEITLLPLPLPPL